MFKHNSHNVDHQDTTIDLSQTFPNELSDAEATSKNEEEDEVMHFLSEMHRAEATNDRHELANEVDTNQS